MRQYSNRRSKGKGKTITYPAIRLAKEEFYTSRDMTHMTTRNNTSKSMLGGGTPSIMPAVHTPFIKRPVFNTTYTSNNISR